jgi:hypothetical protein
MGLHNILTPEPPEEAHVILSQEHVVALGLVLYAPP